MIRITPIGTCRIHTPLSRATARYPIELDLRRNYGFVHTSDEALQQLRFLQGEKTFPAEVLPLVFRPGNADDITQEKWEPSDLNLVEISSAKRVLCGDDAVQINYVYRYFGDFFGSGERSRQFWNIVRTGHRRDLQTFLSQQSSYQALSPSDREMLERLTTEQQTFKTVRQDMAEIAERLGVDRVLFVTHVNATTPDGEVIPSRDRLIRWVKLAASQLGAAVFDPTEIMLEWSQERALENRGLDLTHYQPGFSDRLYEVMHERHIAELAQTQSEAAFLDGPSQEAARLAARLEIMIAGSDFIAGSRELFAALDRYPDSLSLVRLRGVVRSRIGDFRGAVTDLEAGTGRPYLSPLMEVSLLEALNASGRFQEALSVAERLIAQEVDNAEIHSVAAAAAASIGRIELASAHAKQSFRMNRGDLSAALEALKLLVKLGQDADIDEWRGEILENIGSSSSGAFDLCMWAVRHRDEDLFTAALPLVARTDKWSTIDLIEEAAAAGLPRAVGAAIPVLMDLGRLAPGLADRRSKTIHGALDQARHSAELGEVGAAYQVARALAALPQHEDRQMRFDRVAGEARRLVREMGAALRKEIARVQGEGDPGAVVSLGQRAGDLVFEDGRSATPVARSYQLLGDAQAGLDLLKRVSPDIRDKVLVIHSTARMAQAVGDYATALEMYGSLRDDESPEAERYRPEIERFFNTAEPRSLKALTLLARAGRFDEAIRLAHAIGRYIGPGERLDREKGRMLKLLRVRLKQIQEGEAELDEREPVLRRMVQINPDDPAIQRRLALEMMRQFRFAEAAECWEKLAALDPGNESAERNRVRCATLAQRRASSSAQVVDYMG